MSRRTQQVSTLVAIIAICAGGVGCDDTSDAAREAQRVFADASAAGYGTCWAGSSRRTADAFESSCEASISTDWVEYKQALRARMVPQYQVRAETNESMAFSRGLIGDVYTVRVVLVNDTTTKTVRVTFRAAPW